MARKRLLGDEIKSELYPMASVAPMCGFFTYGEFYYCDKNDACPNLLLNESMTVLILSESEGLSDTKINLQGNSNHSQIQTIKALSHLIGVTTKELTELNTSLNEKIKDEVEKNMKSELQLFEKSKMAALGEMIGNIAHQWRQPLSMISTRATGTLLKKEMGQLDDNELANTLELINENAQYLSKTIDTFRNFIKSNNSKEHIKTTFQHEIDMALTIEASVLKNYYIELETSILEKELPLFASEGELSQVIINILNNAKDILIEKDTEDKWIKLELYQEKNYNIVTIEDNGGGIPTNVLPRIFEPYFTTKHQSQGTGLGLHMCYKIVTESLEGKLWAHNTQNGAKMFIEIPIKPTCTRF
jgi:C4-dicarboxylate-specific signal transduction histidine kinase